MTLWHLFLKRKKWGAENPFFHMTKEVQTIFFLNFRFDPRVGSKGKNSKRPPKNGEI